MNKIKNLVTEDFKINSMSQKIDEERSNQSMIVDEE